jgi:hypothetical protein
MGSGPSSCRPQQEEKTAGGNHVVAYNKYKNGKRIHQARSEAAAAKSKKAKPKPKFEDLDDEEFDSWADQVLQSQEAATAAKILQNKKERAVISRAKTRNYVSSEIKNYCNTTGSQPKLASGSSKHKPGLKITLTDDPEETKLPADLGSTPKENAVSPVERLPSNGGRTGAEQVMPGSPRSIAKRRGQGRRRKAVDYSCGVEAAPTTKHETRKRDKPKISQAPSRTELQLQSVESDYVATKINSRSSRMRCPVLRSPERDTKFGATVATAQIMADVGREAKAMVAASTRQLCRAVMDEDLDTLKALLDGGADIEARNGTGLSLLELARERGKWRSEAVLTSQLRQTGWTGNAPAAPSGTSPPHRRRRCSVEELAKETDAVTDRESVDALALLGRAMARNMLAGERRRRRCSVKEVPELQPARPSTSAAGAGVANHEFADGPRPYTSPDRGTDAQQARPSTSPVRGVEAPRRRRRASVAEQVQNRLQKFNVDKSVLSAALKQAMSTAS